MNEILEDAMFLGITNLEELQMFKNREQRPNESLAETLKRFRREVEYGI